MDDREIEVRMLSTMIVLAALIKRHPDVGKEAIQVARGLRTAINPIPGISDPSILADALDFIENLTKLSN